MRAYFRVRTTATVLLIEFWAVSGHEWMNETDKQIGCSFIYSFHSQKLVSAERKYSNRMV